MKIGIIGGGASGMTAAISAARKGAQVIILEGGDRIGKKILATGNGKCNFTNKKMDNTCFRSNTMADISPFLQQFGVKDTLAFFESLHMLYKDKNGYYYPASEQASSLLDVLRFEIEACADQIQVLTGYKARTLTYQKNGTVKVQCGTENFVFDRVIVACGSKASPKTGSDGSGYQLLRSLKNGCQITEIVPALVQLRCKEDYLKAVAGVRAEGKVSLTINGSFICCETGEIQLTEYGVSGIPVFQISRYASYGCLEGKDVQVHLDFMPEKDEEDFFAYMTERKEQLRNRTMEQFCAGLLNKKISKLRPCDYEGYSLKEVKEEYISRLKSLILETYKSLNSLVFNNEEA
jgi:predicted Rossmann fold flavoprotein